MNRIGRKACFDVYYCYYVRKLCNNGDNSDDNDDKPPFDLSGMWSFSVKWDERMSRGTLLPEARFFLQ